MKAVVFLGLVGIIFLVLFVIFIKIKLEESANFCKILGIVFGILIVYNFAMAIPSIMDKMDREVLVYDESITKAEFTQKPNVYFLIYDEYGGVDGLKRYYDYDNEEFMSVLTDMGVNISRTSHNTESIFTSTIVPNLLNLSYLAEDGGLTAEDIALTENAQMYQMFWHNGYEINMINHLGFLYSTGCNVLNTDVKGEDLSTYILEKSIFEDVNKLILKLQDRYLTEDADYSTKSNVTVRMLEECADYTSYLKPTFTIGYIQMPHTPFSNRADGTAVPEEYWNDWSDKNWYLGNLQYTSDHIIRVIENIKAKDSEALIIIQSDHGVRYPYFLKEQQGYPDYDPKVEEIYMQNTLNLVYYKDETCDIEGLSGINTLRYMFNEVLGTEFEMLEQVNGAVFE